MEKSLQKRRKLIAASVLFTFVMAWVMPLQACFASTGATTTDCVDCTSPAGCDGAACGTSVSSACASQLVPTLADQHPAPDLAFIPVLVTTVAPKPRDFHFAPAALAPAALPIPITVRFCSFQI